jgi:hypothetical protein
MTSLRPIAALETVSPVNDIAMDIEDTLTLLGSRAQHGSALVSGTNIDDA